VVPATCPCKRQKSLSASNADRGRSFCVPHGIIIDRNGSGPPRTKGAVESLRRRCRWHLRGPAPTPCNHEAIGPAPSPHLESLGSLAVARRIHQRLRLPSDVPDESNGAVEDAARVSDSLSRTTPRTKSSDEPHRDDGLNLIAGGSFDSPASRRSARSSIRVVGAGVDARNVRRAS